MTSKRISEQLRAIASAEDFATSTAGLTETWRAADVGVESVEPILRFMEEHPTLDYGMPGPLVHFVEEFHSNGHEEKLIESVSKNPTMVTVWMLNRVLNGTEDPAKRRPLIWALEQASSKADEATLERIQGFLCPMQEAVDVLREYVLQMNNWERECAARHQACKEGRMAYEDAIRIGRELYAPIYEQCCSKRRPPRDFHFSDPPDYDPERDAIS